MFMTNCWQVATYSSELDAGLLKRKIAGTALILYRSSSGDVVAMHDRCPHRHVPLSLGCLDGDIVQCGYHGMRFGPTGACDSIPGQDVIPPNARVRVFPTVEKHRFTWVWMGDADACDDRLVPDFHWMDDPQWATAEGYHHVEADYRLLVDNLLDLSHETFVHPETIGNGAVADSPVSVKVLDRKVVRAHRDMLDCEAPPQFVSLAGFSGRIDRWHTTFYTPPGFCVIEVGAVPAGSKDGGGFEARILNLITPETERSSHYFWAHARNIRLEDAELSRNICSSIQETFDQDKHILEAQQEQINILGSSDPGVVLKVDLGPLQGRSVLKAALRNDMNSGSGETT